MVYSNYKQQRIIYYWHLEKHPYTIAKLLREEGLQTSRTGVAKFLRKYKQTGSIGRRPGSGRPSKISSQVLQIVEAQMQLDDETTAVQLEKILADQGHKLSLKSILRSRSKLGWTFRGSAYCQLIREQNKAKRLEWAIENKDAALNSEFTDVVWTDECSVQLESHRRFCCRKRGMQAKPKPR